MPNLHTMQRDELLSIFHQYCVPYGQRKYKDSGRGKVLNKNRNSNSESPSKPNTIYNGIINTNNYQLKFKRYHEDDLLKPPPDTGHIKRIKLDGNLVRETDKFKRKVPVDQVSIFLLHCPCVKWCENNNNNLIPISYSKKCLNTYYSIILELNLTHI